MTASVESKEQVPIWPTDQLAHTELGWLEDGHEVGGGVQVQLGSPASLYTGWAAARGAPEMLRGLTSGHQGVARGSILVVEQHVPSR